MPGKVDLLLCCRPKLSIAYGRHFEVLESELLRIFLSFFC